MKVQKFVEELSHEERHEIIRTYKIFERDGTIGDEAIRIYAQKLIDEINALDSHITLYMRELANAIFRHYYDKMYLK